MRNCAILTMFSCVAPHIGTRVSVSPRKTRLVCRQKCPVMLARYPGSRYTTRRTPRFSGDFPAAAGPPASFCTENCSTCKARSSGIRASEPVPAVYAAARLCLFTHGGQAASWPRSNAASCMAVRCRRCVLPTAAMRCSWASGGRWARAASRCAWRRWARRRRWR